MASSAVYELLTPAGAELQWTQLKQKAAAQGISTSTLSLHLKTLIDLGMVNRRVDNSTYPPSVFYSRQDPYLFPMKFAEQARLYAELDLVAEIADKGKAGPKTMDTYEEAVNVNLLFMKAALPVILYASLGGKGPYVVQGPGKMSERDQENLLKQMQRDTHALADELLDVVLRPWIHKMLDLLEIFSSNNKGVLEEVARPDLEEGVKALKRYDALLEPYRAR